MCVSSMIDAWRIAQASFQPLGVARQLLRPLQNNERGKLEPRVGADLGDLGHESLDMRRGLQHACLDVVVRPVVFAVVARR